jgi:hypothetical protein
MNKIKSILIASTIFISLLSTSCKKKEKETESQDSFDRTQLMTNIGNNLILPNYVQFQAELNQLNSAYTLFISGPTSFGLTNVQNQLVATYISWQHAKTFEFGPAMNVGLRNAIGTFPTDTSQVLLNINAGSYDLAASTNTTAIGLSSVEFLLFRTNAFSYFSDENYKNYGSALISKMQFEINQVINQWQGGYVSQFIASTGTESTSAFSRLVNEFTMDYELTKNAKLGIPLGKQSLDIQRPEFLETRRVGISLLLIKESIIASQNIFNGIATNGSNGIGFDDYLDALERGSLKSSINTIYNEITSQINTFSGTLEQNMSTNAPALNTLYTKITQQVVNIKTDMPSSFGVLITYQDNDGD